MNLERESYMVLIVGWSMGGSPMHWKNLMPFSRSTSSRCRYSLMKFYSITLIFLLISLLAVLGTKTSFVSAAPMFKVLRSMGSTE